MIQYHILTEEQAGKLEEIDRSEHIDLIFEMKDGRVVERHTDQECPSWDADLLEEIKARFMDEIRRGGLAVGAFDGETLVGFGVLGHRFRGMNKDQLQVDLMYVSRNYRRQGIGSRMMDELMKEARRRGAKYLYVSSTETRSAVSFYKSRGSRLAEVVDEELYAKEPNDIHMVIEL